MLLSATFNIIALHLEDNCQLIIFPVKKNESKKYVKNLREKEDVMTFQRRLSCVIISQGLVILQPLNNTANQV